MKLKIEIDLEELYCEEDETITEAIANSIRYKITQEFWEKFKDVINVQITKKLDSVIDSQITEKATKYIDTFFENDSIPYKERYQNEVKYVALKDIVKDRLASAQHDMELPKRVKLEAEKQGKEIKERYDMLFASQLVSKLNENGMLKKDIAKLILPEK